MGGDRSEVKHFYNDAVIFITGGTGFIGKLLIEKLLRCTLVAKIFILVRCKKDKNESTRYQEIFGMKLFDELKKERPDFMRQVELITGDCVLPNLGISELDWNKLKANVSVVFHCAATVRFDQKLKTATYINVRATKDIIKHAKEMKKLKAIVHVSTAYASCPRKDIDEVFYEPGLSAKNLLRLADCLTDEQLSSCTSGLLGNWPNTYVFTKCVSEDVIRTDAIGLPIALVRPSIVISTYKEPISGWIDNFYGPGGVTYGVGLGLLRTLYGNPENFADMVPADYFINMMMTSAWKVSQKNAEENQNINIYNYVSTPEAPITWNLYTSLCTKNGLEVASPLIIWKVIFSITPYLWLHNTKLLLLHWVPAYIVDFFCLCLGKKARMVEGYKKIHKFIGVIQYFTNREWDFGNRNTQELWSGLNEEDMKMFPFSMGRLDWREYHKTYMLGARLYLLNDPIETIPAGKRKLFIINCMHYTLVFVLLSCSLWLLFKFGIYFFV